ncbi:type II pantothenate kinase [Sporolactobacillus sp. CPB3-1]|uniref:Type II pantothenate kinase n=1 Tax=Sporolactobacillus mangiferae TaxID=2940498 RepID=A0ABT0M8F3_9BACL|nr:type II pantothenate kinase [Sporolactobacillus mangiferae]
MSTADRIGVDAGGTLIKAAVHREEKWIYRSFPLSQIDACAEWLHLISSERSIHLTGGKAGKLKERLRGRTSVIFPEFAVSAEGARQLIAYERDVVPDAFLLTNVGTGTSLNYVHSGKIDWMGGSGVGGGTIIGLSGLLTGIYDFDTLIQYASRGRRTMIDLTVARIYEGEEPPIAGDLTASNFGAVSKDSSSSSPEDQIASVIGLVAETVTSLSILAAQRAGVNTVIFAGSTFSGNELLTEIVKRYCAEWGITAMIPRHGAYCGAIGAACS